MKRKEVKSKGEKERYKNLNAEFQRITRREESLLQGSMQRNKGKQQNGKDYISLQKIGDTKGIFHAKMDSIKDRNGMDLIEAENIKKRW